MSDIGLTGSAPGSLACSVVGVPDLLDTDRAQLLALMRGHFDQVDAAQFYRDLDEKPSVVLVREAASSRICGFSTITYFDMVVAGELVGAVFAGDTVIEPQYWGHSAWVYAWARHSFEIARHASATHVYLLLLTSTHRSYRFMPGFFQTFYPRPDVAIPKDVQARLDALTLRKFPTEYDAARGIVALHKPTPVRPERNLYGSAPGDTVEDRFFVDRNPGYLRGDYLACIAEFTWENLTALGRRVVSERA